MSRPYVYTSNSFPEEAKSILREAGFQQKKHFWFRLMGTDIIQFVGMDRRGFQNIAFSSDPLFVPLFFRDPAGHNPYRDFDDISFERFYANELYGPIRNVPPDTDFLSLRLLVDNDGEARISAFITETVADIVLPYLDRCVNVSENLSVRKELHYLKRKRGNYSLMPNDPDVLREYMQPAPFLELCYLERYEECVDLIDKFRAKMIGEMEAARQRLGDERADKLVLFYINKYQDIYSAAKTHDTAWFSATFQSNFEQATQSLKGYFKMKQEMSFVFPGGR